MPTLSEHPRSRRAGVREAERRRTRSRREQRASPPRRALVPLAPLDKREEAFAGYRERELCDPSLLAELNPGAGRAKGRLRLPVRLGGFRQADVQPGRVACTAARAALDPLYAVLLIDRLVIKVRGSQVANRPVYVAIGVDLEGERDVLGLWLGPVGGEGAKQRATMLTEPANRGLQDALIVCCEGLKGAAGVDPDHLAAGDRPDLRRAHGPRQPPLRLEEAPGGRITAQMREIYTAPTVEAAETRFADFAAEWQATYPAMSEAWRSVWNEFVPSRVPRRAAEGRLHHQRDRVAERTLPPRRPPPRPLPHRTSRASQPLPRRDAEAEESRKQSGKINGWKSILNTLTVHYGDRIAASNIN